MNPDLALYNRDLQKQIDKLCGMLGGLNEQQLNFRPAVADANSIYVIATHMLGNLRAWVLGICCGQPIERDRPAEFAASGSDATMLIERARALGHEVEAALAALPHETLDQVREARQQLWGAGTAAPVTGREAVLHALEHACEHLGQIELTRDMAVAAR